MRQWLDEQGCPYNQEAITAAIEVGDDDTVKPAVRVQSISPIPDWVKEWTYNGDLEIVTKSDVKYIRMKVWSIFEPPRKQVLDSNSSYSHGRFH